MILVAMVGKEVQSPDRVQGVQPILVFLCWQLVGFDGIALSVRDNDIEHVVRTATRFRNEMIFRHPQRIGVWAIYKHFGAAIEAPIFLVFCETK
jgi:hypothetical protein